jgi:antitoxin CptB
MEKLTDQQRIYWRSRRGMKELDLLLIPFVEKVYLSLSELEQQTLAELLEATDPQLYSWLLGYSDPVDKAQQALCEKIRRFHQHPH